MTGRKRNIRDNFENSDLKMFPENLENDLLSQVWLT